MGVAATRALLRFLPAEWRWTAFFMSRLLTLMPIDVKITTHIDICQYVTE
jgi:hypothetical protein